MKSLKSRKMTPVQHKNPTLVPNYAVTADNWAGEVKVHANSLEDAVAQARKLADGWDVPIVNPVAKRIKVEG